ncbi:DNA cytosine methyltransferase [Microvirga tunisiensis]|uniref:DNA cytosine methyltransferase n=1 Tax=Microvirga tunisiensis TaxID=2108360 RepID=A0A5N7MVA0_9HYPH|nr:DNA cytosine methyltransferase [Microvirga tunisiensis]MPR12078.1 DNA cytosine methyltransferase [Microvirga tunisiensis]MPR30024.1 DNA cytosine methyltransferase [Microvirga tunisiensis]
MGFRDNAIQRFVWPAANQNYVDNPWTITAALVDMVASRDWKGIANWVEMADALAPTITGGSPLKRGMDLGQSNTRLNWQRLGINPKKIANRAPGPDDEDLFLTLPMLAKLQNFPAGWKFRGPKVAMFRQIANAFPHVVALHLGCAIRSALTGISVDPREEMRRYFKRSPFSPKAIHLRSPENGGQITPVALPAPVRSKARLNLSKLSQRGDETGPDDFD